MKADHDFGESRVEQEIKFRGLFGKPSNYP
jgi:hypothetical protein